MRTCHLVESATLTDRPATAALLADFLHHAPAEQDHVVWTVGPHAAPDAAQRLGLPVAYHARVAGKMPGLRARALGGLAGFDCVHAWTYGASTLTTFLPRHIRRRLTLTHSPHPSTMKPAAVRAQRRRPAESICVVDHIAAGLTEHDLDRAGSVTLDPVIDRSRIDPTTRRELRMRAGVASDDTLLVAALDEPPGRIDALRMMLAVGLVAETGRDVRLVVGPNARGLDRAVRVTASSRRRREIVVLAEADEPWRIIPAADVGIVTEPGLGSAWAMAGGLAIVSPRAGGGLVAGRNVELARNTRAGELARAIRKLHEDRDHAARLGAAAAEDAERFTIDGLAELYGAMPVAQGRSDDARGIA